MERMATSYFKEVYTKDPMINPDVMLECIVPKVSTAMNDTLCLSFNEKEVDGAKYR